MAVYSVTDLCFGYPAQTTLANANISFQIEKGDVFALLGPNGAGKTTLVKQMVNLLTPNNGTIYLLDSPVNSAANYTARHVSYMPQSGEALNNLTVGEILFFAAHLRGMQRHNARRERDLLIDALDMGSIRHRPVMGLSGGQRRLALLGTTLAANRPVMILDEPTNDLDPLKRKLVWDLLRQRRRESGTTIVLVTHNIIEAEPIIDRLGIMAGGRLLTLGRLGELKAPLRHQLKLDLRFAPGCPPEMPPEAHVLLAESSRLQLLIPQEQAPGIVARLVEQSQIEDFVLRTPTLEDLYLNVLDRTT